MDVFTITKEGVSRHEIVGITTNLDTAIRWAREAFNHEPDDYHDFEIRKFTLDALPYKEDGEFVLSLKEYLVTKMKELGYGK